MPRGGAAPAGLLAGEAERYSSVADRLGARAVEGSALDRLLRSALAARERREAQAHGNTAVAILRQLAERRVRRDVGTA